MFPGGFGERAPWDCVWQGLYVQVTGFLSTTNLPHEAVQRGFERALCEAADTMGATAPNPSVGCVLLDRSGNILSVGVHPGAGLPHAEVMALEAARQAGLYDKVYAALVTLEPCSHYGRTPPCAERLRESPVQEVWVGVRDLNPAASGGGKALCHGLEAKKVFFLEDIQKQDSQWSALVDRKSVV